MNTTGRTWNPYGEYPFISPEMVLDSIDVGSLGDSFLSESMCISDSPGPQEEEQTMPLHRLLQVEHQDQH